MAENNTDPADRSASGPDHQEPKRLLNWEGWLIAFIVVAALTNGIARLAATA